MTILEIERVAHGGHCVARLEGRTVFVRHTLPGERVRVAFTDAAPDARFWRADAVEVISASPDRVPQIWPEAGPGGVGGAELGHVSLAAQLHWKTSVLQEAFTRFAGNHFPGEVHHVATDVADNGLATRTRVTATFTATGEPGMFTHRGVVPIAITSMPLAQAAVTETLLAQRGEPGARVRVIATSGGAVRAEAGATVTVSVRLPSSLISEAEPAHIDYSVPQTGFWQVHHAAPAELLQRVLPELAPYEYVWDLYSGVGLFAQAAATLGHQVTAVELDRTATRAARPAYLALGVRHFAQDVRRYLVNFPSHGQLRKKMAAAAVVLDPPRSGAGRATLTALTALHPAKIIYVACDPVALARDTGYLVEMGYHLSHGSAVDLFPHTHHFETIAIFLPHPST